MTSDLVDVACRYADIIKSKYQQQNFHQIIEDECCNLQQEIRKILYYRISVEFNKITDTELKNKLFKIINDL